ncbi:MAG: hypothetical protein SGILL_009993 [Bacillariaceae sp.]
MTRQRHSLSNTHLYNSNNKKSIGDLAKRLNCAGAKVKDEEMFAEGEHSILVGVGKGAHVPGMKLSSSWGGALRRNNDPHHFDPNITRPVLITVKDGHLPMGAQKQQKASSPLRSKHAAAMAEMERTFSAAWKSSLSQRASPQRAATQNAPSPPKSSAFKFGSSVRSKKERVSFQNPPSPQSVADPIDASGNRLHLTITTNDGMGQPMLNEKALPPYQTAKEKEAARKERWKKGLEMEKQRKTKTPSPQEGKSAFSGAEEDSLFEDTTHFTNATGDSSYLSTDLGSDGSYSSGTDGTETDDSGTDFTDGSSKYHRRQQRSSRNRNVLKSPPRYDPSNAQCSSKQQIMGGIAEDFGIIASMLWSDGSACIGTAAAITKETVTGCRDEP